MQNDVIIRQCQEKDIRVLRKIAVDTAYFGSPCEHFFPDRELLADLIMEYYVRYEPEHTWVAEFDGNVVGYLCAGFDEARYSRYMLWRILPKAFIKAFGRGKIFSKKTLWLIWYNIYAYCCKQGRLTALDEKKYSVHIHQNVKEGFRGKKIGSRLVESFLEYVDSRRKGVRFRALRRQDAFSFFERYGFQRHDCRRMPVWEKWLGKEPLYFMEYVRDVRYDKKSQQ
ncbi:MAG: GNAT family N-acetyltransferase [Candidatus Omnitrophota bacterium]|nr:MAG: GNAT family N-acetyltransferase [Candidatus Omnitrophota bacterium]